MTDKKVIDFELLGSFSHSGGVSVKAGKKALSFLQYLVVHHTRSISFEELIERFWPEDICDAPGIALRRMMYTIRRILETMFPETDSLLITLPNCYVWNPDICLRLDTELFEAAYMEARKVPENLGGGKSGGEEKCRLLLQAVALYKGDFLAGNDSSWVPELRQYYMTLYLDACKEALPLLYQSERWMELLDVCAQAYRTDFAVEEFTLYRMRALIAIGQPEQAIRQFEVFRDRMLEEYEIMPSREAEQLSLLAAGLRKKEAGDQDVFNLVMEDVEEPQAFFCPFEIFRKIAALERRHIERSGQPASLVVVSIGDKAVPVTDARRLERLLLEKLRSGDPVARLGADSYILLLIGANEENARLVMGRIDTDFHRTYRHSNANITYRIAPLRREKTL